MKLKRIKTTFESIKKGIPTFDLKKEKRYELGDVIFLEFSDCVGLVVALEKHKKYSMTVLWKNMKTGSTSINFYRSSRKEYFR